MVLLFRRLQLRVAVIRTVKFQGHISRVMTYERDVEIGQREGRGRGKGWEGRGKERDWEGGKEGREGERWREREGERWREREGEKDGRRRRKEGSEGR